MRTVGWVHFPIPKRKTLAMLSFGRYHSLAPLWGRGRLWTQLLHRRVLGSHQGGKASEPSKELEEVPQKEPLVST